MESQLRSLVTGAGRGLGLEFTRQLLARGDRVIATCRQPGTAIDLSRLAAAHPGHLQVLPLDVGKPASVLELAREVGLLVDGLNLLINNAGILHSGERFGAVGVDALQTSFMTNAAGPFALTQALAPLLQHGARASGRPSKIANVSSQLGSIADTAAFRTPSYAISKAAQNMVTALLARALAEHDVAVVALHPGWVHTAMGGEHATITAAESVTGLLDVIDRLPSPRTHPELSGRFLDWQGKALRW